MRTKYFLFALSSFLLFSQFSNACSCTGPVIFENSISDFTAWVEIIGRKQVFKTSTQIQPNYVTVLRVKEEFSKTNELDTIYLLEDTGFECYKGLSSSENGKEFIISGSFDSIASFSSSDSSISSQRVFILDLCAEGELRVENNKVIGFIDQNKYVLDSQKMSYKSRELDELWMHYYEMGYLSGDSRAEYVAKYDRQREKYEKKVNKLEKKLDSGKYYQSMSIKKFRSWLKDRIPGYS